MKIAVLSNINCDYIIRALNKKYTVCLSQGYGNLYETILNKNSGYNQFNSNFTFIIIDILELLNHKLGGEIDGKQQIDNYFKIMSETLNEEETYFLSDIDFRFYDAYISVDTTIIRTLEAYWNNKLRELQLNRKNVYRFEYKKLIEEIGRDAFYSEKMWYLGKIPFSIEATQRVVKEIESNINSSIYAPKKVLLLDLDNTLWGGVVGEDGIDGVMLSDEKTGLIYKDVQRIIYRMKQLGVIIGIVSKNNFNDAMQMINEHPHMILRDDDFSIKKINWVNKDVNIAEISNELNLGLDSIVFIDDNPMERELVRKKLPSVTVPEFVEEITEYPRYMYDVYVEYFKKLYITEEDLNKTQQYRENKKRNELAESGISYEAFLQDLEIKVSRVDAETNIDRIHQLINKTNQFNLTTKRLELKEIQLLLKNQQNDIFSFKVRDKFGDLGLVAVVIIRTEGKEVYIENFLMSCRTMGRKIENYIIEYVENYYRARNYERIYGKYIASAKNQAVRNFYTDLGYQSVNEEDGQRCFFINLNEQKERIHFVTEE